ncbi:hypothetical protein BR93DRAFT_941296 [Coniochaeta sp. PMI_546]|nr:hypothetical protein BR93DRAFT_941296 [Coniochaeta sp. PMI_546]
MMTMISLANSSQIPTWNNLDLYAENLIRQSYLAAWEGLHQAFDEGPEALASTTPAVSRVKATVSYARVFSWLGISLLTTLAVILLLALTYGEKEVVDSTAEENEASGDIHNIMQHRLDALDNPKIVTEALVLFDTRFRAISYLRETIVEAYGDALNSNIRKSGASRIDNQGAEQQRQQWGTWRVSGGYLQSASIQLLRISLARQHCMLRQRLVKSRQSSCRSESEFSSAKVLSLLMEVLASAIRQHQCKHWDGIMWINIDPSMSCNDPKAAIGVRELWGQSMPSRPVTSRRALGHQRKPVELEQQLSARGRNGRQPAWGLLVSPILSLHSRRHKCGDISRLSERECSHEFRDSPTLS